MDEASVAARLVQNPRPGSVLFCDPLQITGVRGAVRVEQGMMGGRSSG